MTIYTVITFYENGNICDKYIKSFNEYEEAEKYSFTHYPNSLIVSNTLKNK